jgi:uncharacterized protein YciI
MAYHALFYEMVEDFVARRAAYRDEHLRLARESFARGELVLAGALADPPAGALLVFSSADASAAETFARNDPYVKNGVAKTWKVRPWTVVVGNEEPRARSKSAEPR